MVQAPPWEHPCRQGCLAGAAAVPHHSGSPVVPVPGRAAATTLNQPVESDQGGKVLM